LSQLKTQNSKLKILPLAFAVFQKDWRSEWRTRAGLSTSLLFALAAPIALSFNLARQKLAPETLAGLLWTILLFAALIGMGRAFIKEEESGTGALLRLHYPPDAVLWGKTLFNFCLLLLTQIASVPVIVVMLGAHIARPDWWLLSLFLGDIGLAAATTLLGALAAQARAKGALFAAIAIPVLLPLLVAVSIATASTLSGTSATLGGGEFWPAMQIVIGYDLALLAAGWMLFDYVWSA
jgi:heme exporter protein B